MAYKQIYTTYKHPYSLTVAGVVRFQHYIPGDYDNVRMYAVGTTEILTLNQVDSTFSTTTTAAAVDIYTRSNGVMYSVDSAGSVKHYSGGIWSSLGSVAASANTLIAGEYNDGVNDFLIIVIDKTVIKFQISNGSVSPTVLSISNNINGARVAGGALHFIASNDVSILSLSTMAVLDTKTITPAVGYNLNVLVPIGNTIYLSCNTVQTGDTFFRYTFTPTTISTVEQYTIAPEYARTSQGVAYPNTIRYMYNDIQYVYYRSFVPTNTANYSALVLYRLFPTDKGFVNYEKYIVSDAVSRILINCANIGVDNISSTYKANTTVKTVTGGSTWYWRVAAGWVSEPVYEINTVIADIDAYLSGINVYGTKLSSAKLILVLQEAINNFINTRVKLLSHEAVATNAAQLIYTSTNTYKTLPAINDVGINDQYITDTITAFDSIVLDKSRYVIPTLTISL